MTYFFAFRSPNPRPVREAQATRIAAIATPNKIPMLVNAVVSASELDATGNIYHVFFLLKWFRLELMAFCVVFDFFTLS